MSVIARRSTAKSSWVARNRAQVSARKRQPAEGTDHRLHLFLCEVVVERQGERAARDVLGEGQHALVGCRTARGCRAAGGAGEKYARLGMPSAARRHDRVTIDVAGEGAPRTRTSSSSTSGGRLGRAPSREPDRRSVYVSATCVSLREEGVERADLRDAQGGGHLVHAVVEPQPLVLEPRTHLATTLVAEAPAGRGRARSSVTIMPPSPVVICLLGRRRRSRRARSLRSAAPESAAPIASQQSSISRRSGAASPISPQLGGMPEHIHHHARRRVSGFVAASSGRIQVVGVGLDVDEDGRGPLEENGVDAGREREGRDEDLVTGPDPERSHDQVESGSAGADGDGVLGAYAASDPALEAFREWTDGKSV